MKKKSSLLSSALFVLLSLSFLLSACSGSPTQAVNPTSAPTAEQAATTTPDEPTQPADQPAGKSTDIGSALNLVVGTTENPSVFPSYHMVANTITPALNDDQSAIITQTTHMTADAQGQNVHLMYTPTDSDKVSEGYIIGEKEYRMTDGKPEEMNGQIALSWAMWHLHAIFPFAAGAAFSTKTGTETLSGRQADVYTIDSAKADQAVMQAFRSTGLFPLNTIKGTFWIDQKTGGVLKAVVDYNMDLINNSTEKTIGKGDGHLDIEITQVGAVTVKLP